MGSERDSGSGFFTGFLIGGIVGFAAGLLLAPRSGEEARAFLLEHSQEWRDKADELTAAARERMAAATPERRRSANGMNGSHSYNILDMDDEDA